MKPLFSYYGGKQRIASRIATEIWKIKHSVYTEPFAGGTAVLFAKGLPAISNADHYHEVINDTNEQIINLYRVAINHPEELERRIRLTPYSQSMHRQACEICRNGSDDIIELAWAVYVNLQQSFAHIMNSGWRTAVFGRNEAATWDSKKRSLPAAIERLSQVHIGCEDALRFIERWDSPQTLHYVDPPYSGTDQGHYSGYSVADWEVLCNVLDSIEGSYILSNYQQPTEPKSAQQKIEINAICSASAKGKVGKNRDKSLAVSKEERGDTERTEILWICDRSNKIRSELQGVVSSRYNQLALI